MYRLPLSTLLALVLSFQLASLGCGDSSVGGNEPPGPAAVETTVKPQVVVTGQSFLVTCALAGSDGLPMSGETTFTVKPAAPAKKSLVTPGKAGTYSVACATPDGAVVDDTPAIVYVIDGDQLDKVVVDTKLSNDHPAVDETVTVTCTVALDGDPLSGILTEVHVSPEEGVVVEDHEVTGKEDGVWEVACGIVSTQFVDQTPAELTVGKGNPQPATVKTELSKSTAAAGETVEVTCVVIADDGSEMALETVVEAPSGVGVTGHTLTAQQVGTHTITCKLAEGPDVELLPAELTVTPGPPTSVEAWAEPKKASYLPDDTITIRWKGADELGNEVADPPAKVTAPTNGIEKKSDVKFKLLKDGIYPFTVTLTAPSGASDGVEVICDGSGPVIVIDSPERGQTFDGDGKIPVTGTVHDELGGVVGFSVNGVPVAVAGDGSWKYQHTSVQGLNVIVAEAKDTHDNPGKSTVAWYYSTDFVVDDAAKVDEAWLPSSVRVWLSQEIIDDGDHTEEKVDDLAHLLEVLLGNVNFATLLGKPVLFEQKFPNVVDVTVLDDPPIGLKGDLHIFADIDKIDFGKATLSLTSREGGIDMAASFVPDGGAPGLTVHLKVHVLLTLKASADLFGIPAVVKLDPPPGGVTTTSLTIDTLDIETSFDVSTGPGGKLVVAAKKFGIDPKGIYLAPLDALALELGTVSFEVAGFPLPFKYKLPTMDLSSLVAGLDDIVGGLVSPILDAIVPLVTTVLEPIVTLFGADALTSAFQSLELDQKMALPELIPGQPPAEMQVKAKIDSVKFTPAGGAIGLKALAAAEKKIDRDPLGSILRDACLKKESGAFELPKTGPMEMALALDLLNEVLFSVWWNGGLSISMDGKDIGALAGLGIEEAQIVLDPLLPPIFSDCNPKSTLKLQIGDAHLDAQVMFGAIAIDLLAWVSVEIDVALIAMGDEIGIQINGISLFQLEIYESKGDFEGKEAALQELIETMLIDQLLGSLTGDALGTFPIPEIDLGGIVEGVPEGTVLSLGGLQIKKSKGFLQIEGNLQ